VLTKLPELVQLSSSTFHNKIAWMQRAW